MGEHIGTLGTFGQASDSGIDRSLRSLSQRVASIKRGAPPYNLPTQVAVAPNGDLYSLATATAIVGFTNSRPKGN